MHAIYVQQRFSGDSATQKTGDGEYRLFSTTVYGMRLLPDNIGQLCDSAYTPYIVSCAVFYMLEYSSIRS